MYSPRLVIILNDIAHRHQSIIKHSIQEVLRGPKYSNTGAGAESVTVDVVEGDVTKSPVIQITFDDHVKLLDKRKMQWTELPDMKKLMEWASTKRDDPKKAEKLAWAVAWDKKKHDTWKAKPWRKKSLSAVLKELNQNVLAAFDQAIEQDMQEAATI
jgi:hypothetical protein